jgi:threonyl-tRNA synthetase
MNLKIRNAQLQKVPYMLVVGDAEAGENAVAVRLRDGTDLGLTPVPALLERMTEELKAKA